MTYLEHDPRLASMRSRWPVTQSPAAVILARRSSCAYGGLRRGQGEEYKGGRLVVAVAGVLLVSPNPRRRKDRLEGILVCLSVS
jgi:hypothetical protein